MFVFAPARGNAVVGIENSLSSIFRQTDRIDVIRQLEVGVHVKQGEVVEGRHVVEGRVNRHSSDVSILESML